MLGDPPSVFARRLRPAGTQTLTFMAEGSATETELLLLADDFFPTKHPCNTFRAGASGG
jgi:hypothetical protein